MEGARVFRASPRYFLMLVFAAAPILAALVAVAVWGNRVVPLEMTDPILRPLAVYVPSTLAGVIVLFLIWLSQSNLGKRFILGKEGLAYENRGKGWMAGWGQINLFRPPEGKRGPLLRAGVEGKEGMTRIDKFFFPEEFDLLVELIDWGRSEARAGRAPAIQDRAPQERSASHVAAAQEGLENSMLGGVGAVFKQDARAATRLFGRAIRKLGLFEDPAFQLGKALKLVENISAEERPDADPMDIERINASFLIICFSRCPGERRKSTSREAAVYSSVLWIYQYLHDHCQEKGFDGARREARANFDDAFREARAKLGLSPQELVEAGIVEFKSS